MQRVQFIYFVINKAKPIKNKEPAKKQLDTTTCEWWERLERDLRS